MIQDDEDTIDRDAWRRVLRRGANEPPRATDERIRVEARRALAPHARHWWLPASLAASLLLAVLVVQWQYDEIQSPALVTESDVATRAPAEEPQADIAESAPAAAQEMSAPPVMLDMPAPPAAPAPAAGAAPATGMTAPAEVRAQRISAEKTRTPEEWYAAIESLRAAGREDEADAELARLERAFPGWLEKHLAEKR